MMPLMKKTRAFLSWSIFGLALLVMVLPLPGKDRSHLLSGAEANDETLVILTSGQPAYLEALVEHFTTENDVEVQVVEAGELSAARLTETSADLVLTAQLDDLVPLIKAGALDTLPPDILWNVNEAFRDPAERWVGLSGQLADGQLTVRGLALAQSANSKPLAERFVLYLYSRSAQQNLVEMSGEYAFLAFGVDNPAGKPTLSNLSLPPFNSLYNSTALVAAPSQDEVAAGQKR